jgi:hypothetical protein
MTQFTCKGVKQINNRISFKHLYHSYLSAFFISAGVPNEEFPEILITKCRSRFYCTWFFPRAEDFSRLEIELKMSLVVQSQQDYVFPWARFFLNTRSYMITSWPNIFYRCFMEVILLLLYLLKFFVRLQSICVY